MPFEARIFAASIDSLTIRPVAIIATSFPSENYPTKVIKIGVNDVYGHSGPAVDLLKEFGLSSENIVKTAIEAVNLK